MVRLKEILSICRTGDQCRFAIKANRPTDLIHIELMGDGTMDYTTHEIAVGGMYRVNPDFPNGTPYLIKADYPIKDRGRGGHSPVDFGPLFY